MNAAEHKDVNVAAGFSLGSNLGDRPAYLRAARDRLAATPGARLIAQSPVYETEPVGVRPEHRGLKYLNAVVLVASDMDTPAWLARLTAIENELGRTRSEDRYAPRTVDIDLIFHGDRTVDGGGLVVPHPRWMQRRFVVQPLADVRPDLVLPGTGRSVREILDGLSEASEKVWLFAREW